MRNLPGKWIIVVIGTTVALLSSGSALAVEKQHYQPEPASTALSPQRVIAPTTRYREPNLLPDLVVEKIWLDQRCMVHFKLRNNSRAPISAQQHRAAKVRLIIGGKHYVFPLSTTDASSPAIDPTGNLRKPEGIVSFNSGQVVSDQQLVRVLIDTGNKIEESTVKNNVRQITLTSGCKKPDVGNLVVRKPMAVVPPRVPPASATHLRPTVDIVSFVVRRHWDTPVATRSGSAADDETSIQIGQSVVMDWIIRACHASRLNTTISAGIGTVSPGEQVQSSPDCSEWRGSKTITPPRNSTYVLEAAVTSRSRMGAVATSAVRVNVAAPVLELAIPEIIDRERTIIFYARNTGTLDYEAPDTDITGRYAVTNWNRTISYASGAFDVSGLRLGRGERVEIGRITLPETPNPYAAETITIDLEVSDPEGFFTDDSQQLTHTHRWRMETRTFASDTILVPIIESQLVGNIRLNNYASPGADSVTSPPVVSGDSLVSLAEQTQQFTIPLQTFKLKVNGDIVYRYVPFINDVSAVIGGRGTGILRHGIIGTRVTFETAGGNEIKGWKQVGSALVDSGAPDVDITKLEIEISAILSVRHGRIRVNSISAQQPEVEFEVRDNAFAWILNQLIPYFETQIASTMRNYVNDLLGAANVRDLLEERINQELHNLGIGYIHRMTLDPTRGMTITHIP